MPYYNNKTEKMLKVFQNIDDTKPIKEVRREVFNKLVRIQNENQDNIGSFLGVAQGNVSYTITRRVKIIREYMIKACVALRLPYIISIKLLNLFGVNLSESNKKEVKCMNILSIVQDNMLKEDIELLIKEVEAINLDK